MTEEQIKAERVKLKNNLSYLRLQQRAGKATAAEVERAELAWNTFADAPSETLKQTNVPAPAPQGQAWQSETVANTLAPEVALIVDELRRQQGELDFQKRSLSMQLQAVPKDVPCSDITKQILELREQWMALGDEIRFVIANGQRPSEERPKEFDAEAYESQLPNDRYQLSKLIENTNINVTYRWPQRMAQAKTEAKKAEYRLKIAKGERELEILRQYFKSIQ
ncbi:hypothetical protein [Runella sp.]|uniref:hypothetical protein n=1 Tax=Runella sp. TaxID=1960881 RepID=UPI003D102198